MSRLIATLTAAGIVMVLTALPAAAQGTQGTKPNFGPYYRAPLSPYLNLGRGGNNAINYFLGTLPESERRSNFGLLNNELNDLENRNLATARGENLVAPITSGVRPAYNSTGTFYGNTGDYYGNNGPRFGVVPQPRIGEPVTRRSTGR